MAAIDDKDRLYRPLRKSPHTRGLSHVRPSGLAGGPTIVSSSPAKNIRSTDATISPRRRRSRSSRRSEQRDDPRLRGLARDRRAGSVLAGELRGEGVPRAHGDGRPAGAQAPPPRGRRLAEDERLLGGEQGHVPGLRGRDAARRGPLDRPRRSSTCAACSGSPARRRRSPRACGATSASASAFRSRSGSRARSSSPRWRAASQSRMGCSSSRRTASSTSSTRCRWSGSGARPEDGGATPRPRDPDGRPGRAAHAGGARRDARTRSAGRHLHALAHNHDRRRVRTGRRRGSIGSQRALGWRPRPPAEIDATLVALVDRVTGRMRSGRARGQDRGAPPPLRRPRPRDPLADASAGDRGDGGDPPRGRASSSPRPRR